MMLWIPKFGNIVFINIQNQAHLFAFLIVKPEQSVILMDPNSSDFRVSDGSE